MGQLFLILIHLLLIGWITFKVYKRYGEGSLKPMFFPALMFKLGAGILLGVVFKYYYTTGDTWALFAEATTFAEHAYVDPGSFLKALLLSDYSPVLKSSLTYINQPRALFAAKIISPLNLITNNHYWLVSLYLSLFSFVPFWILARNLVSYFPKTRWACAIAFLFFPSVVFWSSGVSKESLVMGGLYGALALLVPLLIRKDKLKPGHWILVALGLSLVILIKYYYAVILIPLLIGLVVIRNLGGSAWIRGVVAVGLLGILFLLASWLHPNLHLNRVLSVLIENGELMVANSPGQGHVTFRNLTPDPGSVALNFPWAVFSGLFRPSLIEAATVFQLWVGLENAVLTVLLLAQLIRWRKINHTILLWTVIVYIILLVGFLAMAAPNFGTLVRYKIGCWPFFIYLVVAANPWLKNWSRFAQ